MGDVARLYFDWSDLSAQEALEFEDVSGTTVLTAIALLHGGDVPTRVAAAMVWTARRRSEPELTFEQTVREAGTWEALVKATAALDTLPTPVAATG